ncbi:cytochrome P450 [Tanacetum coccineum]
MGADFPSHWSKEREPTTRINFNKNGEHTSRSNNIDEDGWTWVIDWLLKKVMGLSRLRVLGCLWAPCIFIVVYTPQCIRKKKILWDNLNSILVENDCLSVIVGDFNEVRNPDERIGSLFCPRGANLFNNFISSSGLNDLPLGDMRFTRMNRSGTKLSKLDRGEAKGCRGRIVIEKLGFVDSTP